LVGESNYCFSMQKVVSSELDALLDVLPPHIRELIYQQPDCSELLEVVLDLGRPPEIRFPHRDLILDSKEVAHGDIDYVISRIGEFTGDNRAGIERTLHRISALRNRNGHIIGLTCRMGRAVFGTVKMIQDLIESGKNVLLLGRPGVGKTTMLREVARVLADDFQKRVIVIDTSNEIAGDGDISHPSIGHARRMQVATPDKQHAVMIEAVENHMPEVIIIDEIGTELEAQAARTIAERGVQLVGTAHGNTLENLIINPTLSDLIGGIQTVTLGDEEAKRRHTQKSVLERKAPPTFDVVVEIMDYYKVTVHPNIIDAIDAILHQQPIQAELRWMDEEGNVKKKRVTSPSVQENNRELALGKVRRQERKPPRFYIFGTSRARLQQAAKEEQRDLRIVVDLKQADLFLTTQSYYRRKPQKIRDAETLGIPIYVLKNNNAAQMRQCLDTVYPVTSQPYYIHHVQHMLAKHHQPNHNNQGIEPGGKRK
jgi:stage III sporulation protein SpoIIIAA